MFSTSDNDNTTKENNVADKSAPIPSDEEQQRIDKMRFSSTYGLNEFKSDSQFETGAMFRVKYTGFDEQSEVMSFIKIGDDHWHTDHVPVCLEYRHMVEFLNDVPILACELAAQWQPVTIK